MVFKGVTSIKEEARYICQRVHIYQQNGVLLLATGSVTPHCRHAVLSYPRFYWDPDLDSWSPL